MSRFNAEPGEDTHLRIIVAISDLDIDIADVDIVIQYGPQKLETVYQRFGQAARGRGREGKAYYFVKGVKEHEQAGTEEVKNSKLLFLDRCIRSQFHEFIKPGDERPTQGCCSFCTVANKTYNPDLKIEPNTTAAEYRRLKEELEKVNAKVGEMRDNECGDFLTKERIEKIARYGKGVKSIPRLKSLCRNIPWFVNTGTMF